MAQMIFVASQFSDATSLPESCSPSSTRRMATTRFPQPSLLVASSRFSRAGRCVGSAAACRTAAISRPYPRTSAHARGRSRPPAPAGRTRPGLLGLALGSRDVGEEVVGKPDVRRDRVQGLLDGEGRFGV